jgi:ketosteroid isomerase-like protein
MDSDNRRKDKDRSRIFYENRPGTYLVVGGTSQGRMSGKSWAGGKTPGGRFCNVLKFRDGRISKLHIYLDPDYTAEDEARFRWGQNRKW